jgi:DNA damage-binding protein 1
MSYHYVVTAHKPTRVTHAVVGTFTSPTELNLIIWCARRARTARAVRRPSRGSAETAATPDSGQAGGGWAQQAMAGTCLRPAPTALGAPIARFGARACMRLSAHDLAAAARARARSRSKCTRLEIHTLSSDGLQPVYDVPIYGRVATLFLWRPAGEQTDLIFLTTERFQFCVLAFEGGKIVTRANGDLRDNVGRPAEHAAIAIIDPRCRLIALRIYDGLLKLIPIGPAASGSASAAASSAPSGAGALREPFNVRLEESTVIDLCFLAGLPGPPVLAVLYQDANEARNVRTYKVIAAERDLAEGPWAELHVEQGASMLVAVPLPFGGVLVVGEQQVTYLSAATSISVPMAAAQIRAACKVDADGRRWLLGDESGALSLLVLHTTTAPASGAAPVVAALQLQPLGVTSAPSALAYLDSGLVFVGSAFGDSQLIRLAERGADEGPAPVERAGAGRGRAADCFEVLEVMPNLGPIQDFCVVDLERQGQGQVVCCSGAGKDGSLRILRNGIGIDEHASVELAGIKGLWALRDSSAAAHDSLLVLSFLKESRVLSLRYDELEEAALPGFETAAKTLLCANLAHDLLLQICAHAIQLIACEGPTPRARWAPPDGRTICVAAADGVEIVVALSSPPELVLLRANPDGSLVELARAPLAHEASCLALSNPSYGRPARPRRARRRA